jgi:hypothetical protein
MTISSDEGRNLATVLDAVNQLHVDVAALLETAVGMMQAEGFDVATDAGSVNGLSTAIYKPRDWMPYEVHRFLISERRPNILVALVVLLRNREDKEALRFAEPLVATTWFQFDQPAGKYNGKDWKTWYAPWHTWLGPVPHGEWARRAIDQYGMAERERFDYRFTALSPRAIRLAAVRDADALKSNVIEPLLAVLPAPDRASAEAAQSVGV